MEPVAVLCIFALLALPLTGGAAGVFALARASMTWAALREQSARLGVVEARLDRALAELTAARPSEPVPAPVAVPVAEERAAPTAAAVEAPREALADTTPEVAAPEPDKPAPRWKPIPSAVPNRAAWTPPSPEKLAVYIASALGGVTLLLASLLGLALAIDAGFFGPVPRVVVGLATGSLLFAGSIFPRRRGLPWLASALGGAGLGMLYAALGAATSLYDMVPNWVGFILLCGVTATAFVRADRERDRLMAALGLLGGLATPLFVSSGSNNAIGLFAFLTVLLVGTVETVRRRDWPELLALALAGAGLHYLGWSARWFVADQVPIGLLAPLVMSVPLVRIARTEAIDIKGLLALAGMALGPLAAVIWLGPMDPVFIDPITGLSATRPLGTGPWVAAFGPTLLPLPLWWMERRLPRVAGVAVVATGLLTATFALAWATHPSPPLGPMMLGTLLPLSVAMLAARPGHHGTALAGIPAAFGLAVTLVATQSPEAAAVAPFLVLTGAIALAVRSRSVLGLPAVLVSSGTMAFLASAQLAELGGIAVAGPALTAYGALFAIALLAPRLTTDRPVVAWWVAAAAGPVLFLPLWAAWKHALGGDAIGLLPLLMGIVALAASRVLLREHGVDKQSTTIAIFASIALAGATLALPLQVDSEWLTVGWALEAAALAALTRRLHHPIIRWSALALSAVVAVRLLLNPFALAYGDAAGLPILNWTLYTWGVPALAMLAAAWSLAPSRRTDGIGDLERLHPLFYVFLAIFFGFALTNAEVSHAFQDVGPLELDGHGRLQGMVRSVSWAVFGVGVLIAGLTAKSRTVRFTGFGFVLLAAAKVFLIDLWDLHGLARVGSVLGLGISLLAAAFLFERLVLRQAPVHSRST